ncbi:MAG: S41 family peptidase [Burkholderiaceae bacterium]|nr:S41 family peptidase [Burkholderiaceae bacterium]
MTPPNTLIDRSLRIAILGALLAFHGLVVVPLTFNAVRNGEKMAEPLPLDERSALVSRTLFSVHENYVIPEQTPLIEAALRRRETDGSYDELDQGRDLAHSVSEDMQVAASDRELLLEYLPLRVAGETPPGTVRDIEPVESWPQSWLTGAQRAMGDGGVWNVQILEGNIGFLQILKFDHFYNARDKYASAMEKLKDTRAIIIDFGLNVGGWPEAANTFATYFYDQRTHLGDIYYRKDRLTVQNWTDDQPIGPRYGSKRPVYILTSRNTHGTAEALAYAMQKTGRATIVGGPTMGSAHLADRFPLSEHFQAWVPVARSIDATTGGNWQDRGVRPDVECLRRDPKNVAHSLALQGKTKL